MNRIRYWIWWRLDERFSLDKISKNGTPYVIPYGKSRIVQFFFLCNIWRFVWMWLTFPAWIGTGLYNCGWIKYDVFDKMTKNYGTKKQRWKFDTEV